MIKWFNPPYRKMTLKEMHIAFDGYFVFTDCTGIPVTDDSVYVIGYGDKTMDGYEQLRVRVKDFKNCRIMGAKKEGIGSWLY